MSVEFDPVPLGRPRRRLDPLVIVVVLVVAGLGLAVLKPWERRDDTPNGIAAASPSAVASADAAGSDAPGGLRIDIVTVDRSTPARPLDHPVFSAEYRTPTSGGPTILDTGSRAIVALGVAPHADGVLSDVRISQIRADGSLDPLEAAPMGGVAAGGAVVLAPEGQTAAFPAGRYRIEAVVDGKDRRLDVVIPDAMMLVPPVTTALTWTDVARAHLPVRSFSIDVVSVDWSASTGSVGYPVYAEGRHAPSPEGPTVLDTGGRSIVALGVDPADGSVVRDVRIYRVRADGGLDWVEANPVDGGEAGGPLALAIPDAAIAFPAGRYRVDALVDGAIRRVDVAILGLDGTVPPPSGRSSGRHRPRPADLERPVRDPVRTVRDGRWAGRAAGCRPGRSARRDRRLDRRPHDAGFGGSADRGSGLSAAGDRARRDADVPCADRAGRDRAPGAGRAPRPDRDHRGRLVQPRRDALDRLRGARPRRVARRATTR